MNFLYRVYFAANFTKFDTNNLFIAATKSLKEYTFLLRNFI